ncbi:MAG: amidohydrolase family protein [Chloroflexi bacterium]|nr:amidohydrolase family protein [Chloroflexota bacterium]
MSLPTTVDLLVRSRRILAHDGWHDGAVAVIGERISALVDSGGPLPQAGRILDVGDRVVIPGLVDTHIHLRDPGFTDKEDFESGTRAAAVGGVTTVMDMPNVEPPTNTVERFKAHIANAARKSLVDFGHNAAGTIPENIAGLAEAGATAFKVFMMRDIGRDYPHMPGTQVDDHATLLRICEEVARTGRPLYIHPHDQSLYDLFVHRAWERWGRDYRSYARAWRDGDGVVLDSGIATMLRLQKATGVRLHILHMSTIDGFKMVRAAKAEGRDVTAEANPFALFVTNTWDAVERLGPYCLGIWIPDHHAAASWEEVVDGTIDVIGTDHAPHTREEKEIGWTDMYASPGGMPMVENYLSLLLTEVNAGRISLERVVDLCATRPAQLAGLFPRKGSIAPGSDADLVVLDLERRHTITAASSHYKCGWTPLEGREVQGLPVTTILRGRVIVDDGEVYAEPGSGRFQLPVEGLAPMAAPR